MKEQVCISCDYPTTQERCPECGDSQTEAYKREDERVMAHVRETIERSREQEFIAEAIQDEQEYESRQINSLIGTLVGLALLLSSAAFIAGFASAGGLR